MSDKRVFPRLKKRLVVDFSVDGESHTGFTHDLSHTGFFIVTNSLPPPGSTITATLHLPNDKRVALTGTVVRARRAPPQLKDSVSTGFSLQLSGYVEDYTRFVESIG
jgi:PilZ domain-containing protein